MARPNLTQACAILPLKYGGRMPQTEQYMLHGLCLRLIQGLAPNRHEAMSIARWIADHAEIFGRVPAVIPAGRRVPGVDPQFWHLLAIHLSDRLAAIPDFQTPSFERLHFIV
jgi:hypothetical protein